MNEANPYTRARAFVQALDGLSLGPKPDPEGRRRLAELRRALLETHNLHRVLQAVGEYLADVPDWELDRYVLIAPLVALHKQKLSPGAALPRFSKEEQTARRTSFGASVRKLRNRLKVGQDSLDLRLGALLNARNEDLEYHLRQVVQRIAGHETPIPIDYARLLVDLAQWDNPRRKVQHRWAKHYWQRAAVEQD